jgi:hypothetical protein
MSEIRCAQGLIGGIGDQARERCLPMKRESAEMISSTVGVAILQLK